MIKCPECGEPDSIFFEGVCSIPVISEPLYESNKLTHAWDWDNAEIVDERGYFCAACDASYLDPETFLIQPEQDLTTG